MSPGTRIIVMDGSPWPERVGCTGVIVDGPDHYPWHGLGRNEYVVLLDDDPLGSRHGNPRWSCVMPLSALELDEVASR